MVTAMVVRMVQMMSMTTMKMRKNARSKDKGSNQGGGEGKDMGGMGRICTKTQGPRIRFRTKNGGRAAYAQKHKVQGQGIEPTRGGRTGDAQKHKVPGQGVEPRRRGGARYEG
jgi:hypothetical protein